MLGIIISKAKSPYIITPRIGFRPPVNKTTRRFPAQLSEMKRLKKLLHEPGIFFRDYLNKNIPSTMSSSVFRKKTNTPSLKTACILAGLEQKINLAPFKVDIIFTWVNNQDPEWQQRRSQYSTTAAQNAPHNNDKAHFIHDFCSNITRAISTGRSPILISPYAKAPLRPPGDIIRSTSKTSCPTNSAHRKI